MYEVRAAYFVPPHGETGLYNLSDFRTDAVAFENRVYHGRSLVHDLEIRANVDTTICANDKIPNVTEEPLPACEAIADVAAAVRKSRDGEVFVL